MKFVSEIFKLRWNCARNLIWRCLCSNICEFIR